MTTPIDMRLQSIKREALPETEKPKNGKVGGLETQQVGKSNKNNSTVSSSPTPSSIPQSNKNVTVIKA